MTIEKHQFENIKAMLARAICGEPLPSFKSPEAMQLVRDCDSLASSDGNTPLLACLGVFAMARLIDTQGDAAAAERDVRFQIIAAQLLGKIQKQ